MPRYVIHVVKQMHLPAIMHSFHFDAKYEMSNVINMMLND